MRLLILVLFALVSALPTSPALADATSAPPPLPVAAPPVFALVPEFVPGKIVSKKFMAKECGGQNISPRLHWTLVPPRTQSFLVTVTDSDESNAYHWIVANIPVKTTTLPTNAGAHPQPAYGHYAKSSFGTRPYFGLCPIANTVHHYTFAVYALDIAYLPIDQPLDVPRMTSGHIIAEVTTLAQAKR